MAIASAHQTGHRQDGKGLWQRWAWSPPDTTTAPLLSPRMPPPPQAVGSWDTTRRGMGLRAAHAGPLGPKRRRYLTRRERRSPEKPG